MGSSQRRNSDVAVDAVAAKLPGVAWRVLPRLLSVGVCGALGAFLLLWFLGGGAVVAVLCGVLVVGPTIAVVVHAIERELREGPLGGSRFPEWWQVRRAMAVMAWPSALVGIGLGTLEAWDRIGETWFLLSAVVTAAALCVASVGAVVAAPLAATRGEAKLSSIWRVSLYAVGKSPLAPLGAMAFAGIAFYVAFQYTTAMVLLVLPLVALVADLASRTCATRTGVDFVRCAPKTPGASVK